jgi:hypothetical protein
LILANAKYRQRVVQIARASRCSRRPAAGHLEMRKFSAFSVFLAMLKSPSGAEIRDALSRANRRGARTL